MSNLDKKEDIKLDTEIRIESDIIKKEVKLFCEQNKIVDIDKAKDLIREHLSNSDDSVQNAIFSYGFCTWFKNFKTH